MKKSNASGTGAADANAADTGAAASNTADQNSAQGNASDTVVQNLPTAEHPRKVLMSLLLELVFAKLQRHLAFA